MRRSTKYLLLCVTLCLAGCARVVKFEDTGMEATIREAIGKREGTINEDDLRSIIELKPEDSLRHKLFNVTLHHIRTVGPDHDAARVTNMYQHARWLWRHEFTDLTIPYLDDRDPTKVAGALEILYGFRAYRPSGPQSVDSFQKENAQFFSKLDMSVYSRFQHFHSLGDEKVFRRLAIFLGTSSSEESKRELLRIARETTAKGQALICLAWHHDPADMEALLPFMLEDTQASRSLPYHFRSSYGEAAIPYLERAAIEAKSEATRRKAEKDQNESVVV